MSHTPCGKKLVPFTQGEASIVCGWNTMSAKLAACPDCGYLAFDPKPTESELSDYYGSQYWELSGSLEEARQAYEDMGYYREAAEFLRDTWQQLGRSNTTLRAHEIGCGYGAAVHHMRSLGIQATGTDLSNSAIETARTLGNVYTKAMPLREYLSTDQSKGINLFYMCHSLEHIPEPIEVARVIYDHLEEGGLFVIRVPNGMHLNSRMRNFYEYTWLQYPDHIHYFTPKSSICLLEGAGFEVIKISTLPREDEPHLLLSLLGRRWSELPDPSALIKAICSNWLGMEMQIIARKAPAHETSSQVKQVAERFEANLRDMQLAANVPPENISALGVRPIADHGWVYFAKGGGDYEPLQLDRDGKRLSSVFGPYVHGSLHWVPRGTSMRIEFRIPPRTEPKAVARLAFSSILPSTQAESYRVTCRAGGGTVFSETYVGGSRQTRELLVDARPDELLTIEICDVESSWPTIHFQASCKWIPLATPT